MFPFISHQFILWFKSNSTIGNFEELLTKICRNKLQKEYSIFA
jgi:hypothetical protein